jgi:putative transposase
VQQSLTEAAYNHGKPLSAIALHHAMYARVVGALNSQMTCSPIRLTAGVHASANSNGHEIACPFVFRHARAPFLVGTRGRDADFRQDGTLSIWTVAGRKRLSYTVPTAFQAILAAAKEIDGLTVIERNGRLLGRVTLTLEAPEPNGVHPVGVDLNETNALVAVDPDGTTLFVSGKAIKVANQRNYKTRKRVQQKLAIRKAEQGYQKCPPRAQTARSQTKQSYAHLRTNCRQATCDLRPPKCCARLRGIEHPSAEEGNGAWQGRAAPPVRVAAATHP